jgi:hypothetical protein
LRAYIFAASANITDPMAAASLHKRWRRQAEAMPIASTGQSGGLKRKALPTLENLTRAHADVYKASHYFLQ